MVDVRSRQVFACPVAFVRDKAASAARCSIQKFAKAPLKKRY